MQGTAMATGDSTEGVPAPGATTSTYRQETAVLQSNELAVLTVLEEKTAEIRKKMTLKYQVEF